MRREDKKAGGELGASTERKEEGHFIRNNKENTDAAEESSDPCLGVRTRD